METCHVLKITIIGLQWLGIGIVPLLLKSGSTCIDLSSMAVKKVLETAADQLKVCA